MIKSPEIHRRIEKGYEFLRNSNRVVLITGRRRESFGAGFKNICNAIRKLAASFPEYDFVYPVHLNPNVQKPVQNILNHNKLPNVYLIGPMEYLSFVYSMKKAYLILTDSGGIQEEAITLGKPILVMRNTTERPEGIKSGGVKLVGNREGSIFNECKTLSTNRPEYNKMTDMVNPYGDGKAAERIVKILLERLPHTLKTAPVVIRA
jgi:UDP-N-acetylglucosamine 2-epimerase (non-hydrolysing)